MYKAIILLILFLTFNSASSQITEDKLSAIIDEGVSLIQLSNSERLKEINIELDTHWNTSEHYATDSLKAKYYKYKGGLAIRRWQAHKAIEYYNKVILYSTSDQDMFRHYLGIGVAYQILNQYDKAEKYLLKSLDYAIATGITNSKAMSLSDLANLYREVGNSNLELKYIDLCLLLDRNDKNCELLKANYDIKHENFNQGLKALWEIVILDPEFQDISTIYALMTLIDNYIKASGIDKAEELINAILKNKNQLHNGAISFFRMYQGRIYKKRGMLSKAEDTFISALSINQKETFQNKIWLEIYLLEKDRKNNTTIVSSETTYVMPEVVINGSTGKFIKLVSTIRQSTKSTDLKKHIKENEFIFQKAPKKQIYIYNEIKKTARKIKDYNTYFLYRNKHDSLINTETIKQQNLTNQFFNAQLDFYENQILNRENILNKTESAFQKEKETNQTYVIYLISAIFGFLLILMLLIQTTLRKRKNQKLLLKIEEKNKELEKYTKEYETMLLILSHHVKKPINQLYYSFNNLKNTLNNDANKKRDFLINTISDSTSELSNRISIVLTLLKYRMSNTEHITHKNLNLNELIHERVSNFENLDFQLKFDNKKESHIRMNKESLSIIIDNALENVKKYNEIGSQPKIIISHQNDRIDLEIKNKTKVNMDPKINSRDSFGLGQKIIERLCEELEIKVDVFQTQDWYSLLFTFKQVTTTIP